MVRLSDIAPDFDGSCACCNGKVLTFAESRFGDEVVFNVYCWRAGRQPDGIGVHLRSATGSEVAKRAALDQVLEAIANHWPKTEVWVSGLEDDWEKVA